VPSNRHYATGHVLVTTCYCYAGVMKLAAGDCLDAICDDLASLEGESHARVMSAEVHGPLM
jgi:hypothetical protein